MADHGRVTIYAISQLAVGSLNELETQVQIARRLEYITDDDQQKLLDSCAAIGRMLGGLIRSLRRRLTSNRDSGTGGQASTGFPGS